MSTIHTAMTGKSDSLIDAVRESEGKDSNSKEWGDRDWHGALCKDTLSPNHINYMNNFRRLNELKAKEHYTHPDHPDYMRMVVHQMD